MAYVECYENDIFVSYAHVDNQPLPGAREGWVSTLVKGLTTVLAQKLGRKDAFKLWMDHELSRHVQITPQIIDALSKTATILIILSTGYVASKWCLREKETFLNVIKEKQSSGSRMFVVERNIVDEEKRPDEFKDLKGYKFWVKDHEGKSAKTLGEPEPNPQSDRLYYDQLTDLGVELAKELERLRNIGDNGDDDNTTSTVFLAEVTDDLEPQRDEVKRYLDQHGLQILPESLYPREPLQFQEKMVSDLAKSTLFVQLLSGLSGKRPPGLTKTYASLQYDLASKSGIPILQWRSRDLDIQKITDIDQRNFLGIETVMAVGFEEFKRTIVEHAFYKPPEHRKESVSAFIFVNMDSVDRDLANNVCEHLYDYGAEYVLPLREGKPVEIREDLEKNLYECDGVIIVYGKITAAWVKEQLRQYRKIIARRERPLKALAVYEGPPEAKVPLDMKIQNMQTINCRKGFMDDKLKCFIKHLKGEVER